MRPHHAGFCARMRRLTGLALALLVTLAALAACAEAPRAQAVPSDADARPVVGWADLVEEVLPAVVSVSTVREVTRPMPFDPGQVFPRTPHGDSPFERFLERFFEEFGLLPPERPDRHREGVRGIASGFIIDADGHVVTNHHVVEGAVEIEVRMVDGRRVEAELVGSDPHTDLALLRIEADRPVPFARFGDSDAMRVGDPIIAVGNPFGLGGTVTAGIVSAMGRDLGAGPYDDFLQIDAAINRGNSGGPTFNLEGEVVGVNSVILSPIGVYIGIGFAIPSNLARRVIADLREHGRVERGWLGVHVQRLDAETARAVGLDEPRGALVAAVTPGGPAEAAGLQPGDVILRFEHRAIDDMRDLPRLVAAERPGTTVDLAIWRDGREQSLGVALGRLPAEERRAGRDGSHRPG
jgi:serine protease Do